MTAVGMYDFANMRNKLKSFVPEAETHQGAITVIKHSGQFPSWQWTGVAEFGVILEWCEEHFQDDFIWNFETLYFKHERDLSAFLLRWA